jgi:cholesterol transport system auxiliary component
MKRLAAAVAALAALALSACSAVQESGHPALYDFGFDPSAPAPAALPAKLSLVEVSANSWLHTPAVLYRLAYRDGARLEPYALSRWSAPPAELLTQRLRLAMAAAGGSRFSMANEGIAADYALRIHLEAFEQVVRAPDDCRGVARVRASLAGADRKLRAQRLFQAERGCPSVDAPGAVRALGAAADALVADILQWVAQETAPPH